MLTIELFRLILVMSLVNNLYSINDTRKWKSRKIIDGKPVQKPAKYIVYLTKAEKSTTHYDAWICGGAIVSKYFIVTSAACVEDVQFMYAITGYSKYVNVKDINNDPCTKASRKKIVLICVPKHNSWCNVETNLETPKEKNAMTTTSCYDFAYDKIQKWAFIDIAAVKVESPYDFSAPKLSDCSWSPQKIDINYERRYQEPNIDAIVLGWGHTKKWRSPGDPKDYNQEVLQYSSISTMNKQKCKEMYSKTPELLPIIDSYMICAMYEGNLDDNGNPKKVIKSKADGCPPGSLRVGNDCQEQDYGTNSYVDDEVLAIRPTLYGHQNQNNNPHNSYSNQPSVSDDYISFEDIVLRRSDGNESRTLNYTRKAGICQNDHGGPLVTWVGTRERLIGVASVFRLDKSMSCVGPYLFTSTQCNGAFLDCVINGGSKDIKPDEKPNAPDKPDDPKKTDGGGGGGDSGGGSGGKDTNVPTVTKYDENKSNFCDSPPEKKGFDMTKRRISWRDHPDGPAANELPFDLFVRPVKPIG